MLKDQTAVIFVEGIPGSGKSTFAQRLAFHLQQCGHRARWHHENDRNNPANPAGTPHGWSASDLRGRLSAWKQFIAQAVKDREIVILESALFQRQLNRFVKERKEEDLPGFMGALFKILRPASPILIQFSQPSIRAHYEWLSQVRGDTLSHFSKIIRSSTFVPKKQMDDLSLITAYYSRIQKVSLQYAKEFPGAVIMQRHARHDWKGSFNEVCRSLSLPDYLPPKLLVSVLRKLAGTYKRDDGVELVIVEIVGGRLRIKHDRFLELVDPQQLHFFIDNFPDEMKFDVMPDGATKLRIAAWSMMGSGLYVRNVPDRFTVERVFTKINPVSK
jgi:hypothetical protein